MTKSEDLALLTKHAPLLIYDKAETYRADSAEIVAATPDAAWEEWVSPNYLRRVNGHILASTDLEGERHLDLGFLGATHYRSGEPVLDDDFLDLLTRDYPRDYLMRRGFGDFADRTYGRVVRDGTETWLQYWFFYYYNSFSYIVGKHEGDWEMIQIGLCADMKPSKLTYAQHGHGEKKNWENAELFGEAPIVYVAWGSHACYFEADEYDVERILLKRIKDRAVGNGVAIRPKVELVTVASPAWIAWSGRWGNTRFIDDRVGNSPLGPNTKAAWKDPSAFHDRAISRGKPFWLPPVPYPPDPVIEAVRREGGHAVIDYRFSPTVSGAPDPAALAVSLGAVGSSEPPATYSFPADPAGGTVIHPVPLDEHAFDVVAVSVAEDGGTSNDAEARLDGSG